MGGLFKKPNVEKPKPVVMPDEDDAAVREAEALKRRQIGQRSGRASTVMSQRAAGSPGTQAYQASLLGNAN